MDVQSVFLSTTSSTDMHNPYNNRSTNSSSSRTSPTVRLQKEAAMIRRAKLLGKANTPMRRWFRFAQLAKGKKFRP
jgi:hypothetical protein